MENMTLGLEQQLKMLEPILNQALQKLKAESETVVIIDRKESAVIYGLKIYFYDPYIYEQFIAKLKEQNKVEENVKKEQG